MEGEEKVIVEKFEKVWEYGKEVTKKFEEGVQKEYVEKVAGPVVGADCVQQVVVEKGDWREEEKEDEVCVGQDYHRRMKRVGGTAGAERRFRECCKRELRKEKDKEGCMLKMEWEE